MGYSRAPVWGTAENQYGVQPSTSMGYSREPVWGDSMKISNNLGHIQDVHK